MAAVFVNGVQQYLSDGDSIDAWRLVSLDLSAYDGLSNVTIDFQVSSTTVVERTGWYLDDIGLDGTPQGTVPEPSAVLLLVSGLVALAARRHSSR